MINLKNPKLKIIAIILVVLLFIYGTFVFLGGLFLKHKAIAYVDKNYPSCEIIDMEVSFKPLTSRLKGQDSSWYIYLTYKQKPENAKGQFELFKSKNPFSIHEKIEFFGWH